MTTANSKIKRIGDLDEALRVVVPHLRRWLVSESDFVSLLLKYRDDGTVIAVGKSFASDGSPIVSFGVGYGPIMAICAIDDSIQGGNWRPDKPWPNRKGSQTVDGSKDGKPPALGV